MREISFDRKSIRTRLITAFVVTAPRGEEYRKIHQGHYHHYEDFIEVLAKLEPPLDKRFVKIMDEQLDVIPFEFSEMFIDGFKLGAKMMAEVFRNE